MPPGDKQGNEGELWRPARKQRREQMSFKMMYTGSRNAKRILDGWDAMLPKFVKVMPIDYKRVLAERKSAAAKIVK